MHRHPASRPRRILHGLWQIYIYGSFWFGLNIDMFRETAIIGTTVAEGDRGKAFIVQRNNGNWDQLTTVTARTRAAGEQFGSVKMSNNDNTVIVGASTDDGVGAFYVYKTEDGGSTWRESVRVENPNQNSILFGHRVAINGNYVLIGAPSHDTPETDNGLIFAYSTVGAAPMSPSASPSSSPSAPPTSPPSVSPSDSPSTSPSTISPTKQGATLAPSSSPSSLPPSVSPFVTPTFAPSKKGDRSSPTIAPSSSPTFTPSKSPSSALSSGTSSLYDSGEGADSFGVIGAIAVAVYCICCVSILIIVMMVTVHRRKKQMKALERERHRARSRNRSRRTSTQLTPRSQIVVGANIFPTVDTGHDINASWSPSRREESEYEKRVPHVTSAVAVGNQIYCGFSSFIADTDETYQRAQNNNETINGSGGMITNDRVVYDQLPEIAEEHHQQVVYERLLPS